MVLWLKYLSDRVIRLPLYHIYIYSIITCTRVCCAWMLFFFFFMHHIPVREKFRFPRRLTTIITRNIVRSMTSYGSFLKLHLHARDRLIWNMSRSRLEILDDKNIYIYILRKIKMNRAIVIFCFQEFPMLFFFFFFKRRKITTTTTKCVATRLTIRYRQWIHRFLSSKQWECLRKNYAHLLQNRFLPRPCNNSLSWMVTPCSFFPSNRSIFSSSPRFSRLPPRLWAIAGNL